VSSYITTETIFTFGFIKSFGDGWWHEEATGLLGWTTAVSFFFNYHRQFTRGSDGDYYFQHWFATNEDEASHQDIRDGANS
jgi:hypothetical protein